MTTDFIFSIDLDVELVMLFLLLSQVQSVYRRTNTLSAG